MTDFKSRLIEERDQLIVRLEKLTEFVGTQTFKDLPVIERNELLSQKELMNNYLRILNRRCSRLCNNG